MRRIFNLETPSENYVSDAAVLMCFDARIELPIRKLLKRLGVERPDVVRIAGGPRSLASDSMQTEASFVLEQFRLSQKLHNTKRALLFAHSDCGTYGGLQGKFGGDREAERAFHQRELQKAADFVSKAFPDFSVEAYFVDFDGVWELTLEGQPLRRAS